MSLTNDEMSVLMIADRGEHMLAIGRWEAPTKGLVAKGFMKCEMIAGGPQYTITDAGKAAVGEGEREVDDQFANVLSKINTTQRSALASIEKAAQLLAAASRDSCRVTGDAPETAARKWSEVALRRALELLNG